MAESLSVGEVITYFEGIADGLFKAIDEIEKRLLSLTKKRYEISLTLGEDLGRDLNKSLSGISMQIEKVSKLMEEGLKKATILVKITAGKISNITSSTMEFLGQKVGAGIETSVARGGAIAFSILGTIQLYLYGFGKSIFDIGNTIRKLITFGKNNIFNIVSSVGNVWNAALLKNTLGQVTGTLQVMRRLMPGTFAMVAILPFYLNQILMIGRRIKGTGKENLSVLEKITALVSFFHGALTTTYITTRRLLGIATMIVTTVFIPFSRIFLMLPLVNSAVDVLLIKVNKIRLGMLRGMGSSKAAFAFLISTARTALLKIAPFVEELSKSWVNMRKESTKAEKKIKKLGDNSSAIQAFKALAKTKLPIAKQFQILGMEVKTMLDNIFTQIKTATSIAAKAFGISKEELDIISTKSNKTLKNINADLEYSTKLVKKMPGFISQYLIPTLNSLWKPLKFIGSAYLEFLINVIPNAIITMSNFAEFTIFKIVNLSISGIKTISNSIASILSIFSGIKTVVFGVTKTILIASDVILGKLLIDLPVGIFKLFSAIVNFRIKIPNMVKSTIKTVLQGIDIVLGVALIDIPKAIGYIIKNVFVLTMKIPTALKTIVVSAKNKMTEFKNIILEKMSFANIASKLISGIKTGFSFIKNLGQKFLFTPKTAPTQQRAPIIDKAVQAEKLLATTTQKTTKIAEIGMNKVKQITETTAATIEKTATTIDTKLVTAYINAIKEAQTYYKITSLGFSDLMANAIKAQQILQPKKGKTQILPNNLANSMRGFVTVIDLLTQKKSSMESVITNIQRLGDAMLDYAARNQKFIGKGQDGKLVSNFLTGYEQASKNLDPSKLKKNINPKNIQEAFLMFTSAINQLQKDMGIKAKGSGNAFVNVLTTAIKTGNAEKVDAAMIELGNLIMQFLPQSPAKKGPLKNLASSGKKIAGMIGGGIIKGAKKLAGVMGIVGESIMEFLPRSNPRRGVLKLLVYSGGMIIQLLAKGMMKGVSSLAGVMKKITLAIINPIKTIKSIVSSLGSFNIGQMLGDAKEQKLMAERIGITVEQVSILDTVLKKYGSNISEIEYSLKILEKNVYSAFTNAETRKSFEKLGIDIGKFKNKANPGILAMMELSDVIASIKSSPDEINKALELMGVIGSSKLFNVFKQGSKAIKNMMDTLKNSGYFIDETFAKASFRVLSAFSGIRRFGSYIKKYILDGILPELANILESLIKYIQKHSITVQTIARIIGKSIGLILAIAKDLFSFAILKPKKAFDILIKIINDFAVFFGALGKSLTTKTETKVKNYLATIFVTILEKLAIFTSAMFSMISELLWPGIRLLSINAIGKIIGGLVLIGDAIFMFFTDFIPTVFSYIWDLSSVALRKLNINIIMGIRKIAENLLKNQLFAKFMPKKLVDMVMESTNSLAINYKKSLASLDKVPMTNFNKNLDVIIDKVKYSIAVAKEVDVKIVKLIKGSKSGADEIAKTLNKYKNKFTQIKESFFDSKEIDSFKKSINNLFLDLKNSLSSLEENENIDKLKNLLSPEGFKKEKKELDALRQSVDTTFNKNKPSETSTTYEGDGKKIPFETTIQNINTAIDTSIDKIITNGKLAMEDLAEIGNNLFKSELKNAMTELRKQATEAMRSAFKVIGAGPAAEGLVAGVMGAMGLLLSKLKSTSEQTYNAITETAVESAAAMRGVIAGVENIGIQEVSQKLITGITPLVEINTDIKWLVRDGVTLLQSIDAKMSGGNLAAEF